MGAGKRRVLSFALGNIYRWAESENRNELFEYIRELDVDGVEITFGYKKELYAFKLSEENRQWLRSLDYVSIHSPFRILRAADNQQEVEKQLDIMAGIYKDVNAKQVIIHATDLPAHKILKKYDFNISTENLPNKGNINIERLGEIMDEYSYLGLCLDVSHAYLWSKEETGRLVEKFKDKITQIHFSGTYRRNDHRSLRVVGKDFMRSINPIFDLDVPIVIEEDIETKDLGYVKDEIAFIKNIFE